MEPLSEERDFFSATVGDWLSAYKGKVALVKGSQLVGVFDNESNALAEGARLFKDEPFLVRRIQAITPDASVPAYTLGILNGNTQHPIHWDRPGA